MKLDRKKPDFHRPLTNIEVAEIFRDFSLYEIPFLGVFSVDEIPVNFLLDENYWCIIVNLDRATESGSHFIAVARNPNGSVFVFDSIALNDELMPAIINKLIKALESFTMKKIWRLYKPIQDIFSSACGYYCVFFILIWHFCQATYQDMDQICAPLIKEKNLKKNDLYVYKKNQSNHYSLC